MNLLTNLKEKKKNFFKKENIYYFTIIIIIFCIDRYSKLNIINNFSDRKHFVNDFINLDLIWNSGIGFGLLSSEISIVYNSITAIISLVIIVLFYLMIISQRLDKLIFSIIIGGALGNLYDRAIFNAVPDFLDLHFNNFHWFTFNLADIFITVGIILLLFKKDVLKKND
tara:strand:- start:595 stop:1101 length:507 start_codon:yes stop_codon:yes gene_type:complete